MAFILLFLSYAVFTGCEKANDASNAEPKGVLVNYTGCKDDTIITVTDTTPNNLDCIEYNYNSIKGILKLKHINAGFNCCPGKITADISINSDAIIINEKEEEAGCHCNCLFDIYYEFSNLDSWTFRIVIVEPYRPVEETVLEFDVDLMNNPTGKFCVERNNYPWNIK
jgi:hypothetical protein